MKIFIGIILVIYVILVGIDAYHGRTPKSATEFYQREADFTQASTAAEYYIRQGIYWALDLCIILALIFGLV